MQDYEPIYRETPDALGPPSRVLTEYFASRAGVSLRVLDVGCGQGRDALFIARAGHRVVGVDVAPSGIRDLVAAAQREDLDVEGVIADLTLYTPDACFDIVLCDRVLHMLPADDRLGLLRRLLDHVAPGGSCLILDERVHIESYQRVAAGHDSAWGIEKAHRGMLFLRRPGS